jgi:hypothetical protein
MVRLVNSGCLCSAESVCDSAAIPDERDSTAGLLESPVWEDKPQSYTTTLRYNYNGNNARVGDWRVPGETPIKEPLTYRMDHIAF